MMTHPLNDAMGARRLAARWVIQGKLTLVTALHLGGGESDAVDMRIVRDGRTGAPLLPGTTLAGALRSALADRLVGYGKHEPDDIEGLFGGRRGDDDGAQSPLIVFDAIVAPPEGAGLEVRDGVAISPSTGVAEDHKKYDFEVLPAGTTFPVRVDLLVSPESNEDALLAALAAALDAFSHGGNGFGARRTRGLGKVRAAWTVRRYDLSTKQGWLEWALSDHEPPLPPSLVPIHDAMANARNGARLECLPDARSLVTITLKLRVQHDILVRSAGTTPDAPDVSHLHSGGKPILPGTSLAGVMRAQALRIAKLVREPHGDGDAERWINRLFGPRFEGRRAAPGFEPRASRLHVGEAAIVGSKRQLQARIAIDRFTGGVVDSALFDEQPAVGGSVNLTLALRNPQPGELGLVLLVVKDILDGRLPVGGTSSVGRGFVSGTATLEIRNADTAEPTIAELRPGEAPTGTAAAAVAEALDALRNAPRLSDDDAAMPAAQSGGRG